MNEKRKAHKDYINNRFVTPEMECVDSLACAIKFLLQKKKLPYKIVLTLNNMLRQLEDKNLPPKKILRSIAAKIARITEEHTK